MVDTGEALKAPSIDSKALFDIIWIFWLPCCLIDLTNRNNNIAIRGYASRSIK